MDSSILKNKKVLITAGPTREAIDPVRYISNHSTGKMGYAIAEKFLAHGAKVFLVSGPVDLKLEHANLKLVKVNSANEMYLACCHFFEDAHIAIFAAAVADYRPEKIAEQKIKKDELSFTIKMVKNIDIADEFGRVKTPDQVSVGFALETNDELKHAMGKLVKKNFDMVIMNSMNDPNATFWFDTNKITIVRNDFTKKEFSLKSKTDVAQDIVNEIAEIIHDNAHYEKGTFDYEMLYL